MSERAHTNRLAGEQSPYLLQHAHNPVDWYPWGKEAFERARKDGKPIFLSVGYSTCHWCHVMEHESFENPDIAAILNSHFVCIKVDREERPDIDRIYMTYVQAATGGGGWPMTVWLTPDLKPFAGGTYFPPEDRRGRAGLKNVLEKIASAWRTDHGGIIASADLATSRLMEWTASRADAGSKLAKSLLDKAYRQIKASYEPRYGGFGDAPKFPRPVTLNFMLRFHKTTGTEDALDMCLFTLRKMADGGIHDHIGGGFHRYSVDGSWHVPHFEKMLYDQAQIAISCLEAYQITHDKAFSDVARDTLDYVLRDMTGPEGQFYSAEDADSPVPGSPEESAEGAFYVWEEREIVDALGAEAAEVFGYCYGVEQGGNVQGDHQGGFLNKNILISRHSVDDAATRFGKSPDQIGGMIADSRMKLREVRSRRPRPFLDDKTLTAWNGLMISAFARAAQVLDEPRYAAVAQRAALFIESNLWDGKNGKLLRRHRKGETAINGFADDYAFLIQGLIDLYEACFDVKWLEWAIDLQKKQDALFWDSRDGGYFSTCGDDLSVLLRMKEDYDGAEPSPNSVAALNLLRLSQMTGDGKLRDQAEAIFAANAGSMRTSPSAMPQMLVAYCLYQDKPSQIIVAGRAEAQDTRALLCVVHSVFMPNKIVLLADGGVGQATLAKHMELMRKIDMIDGKAAAYVCENYVCQLPATEPSTLAGILEGKK